MKRRDFIKTNGLTIGSLFLPRLSSARKNNLEEIIDGRGILNGQFIDTFDEEKVEKGINLRFDEVLEDGQIGDFLGETETDDDGNYKLNIDSSSNLIKVRSDDSRYYEFERYINLEENNFNFDIAPRHDVEVSYCIAGYENGELFINYFKEQMDFIEDYMFKQGYKLKINSFDRCVFIKI